MPVEIPNNIKSEMIKIDDLLETQKNTVLDNLDKKVENFRYTLDNLIKHYQTRQDMKSMSLTYKGTNLGEVGRAIIKQSKIGDIVEDNQTDKDLIVGKIKTNRDNYQWYTNKNYYLTLILKMILLLLILINIVHLMIARIN
jgi:predicted transglutaminase-like cysteine proteinase